MSPDPDAPVALSFGAAYERLQEIAAELGADATMAPDRLIALLREGKGLERALRDHLERVEQEVRAIEDGDGAVAFRIEEATPAAARPGPTAAAAPARAGAAPSPLDDASTGHAAAGPGTGPARSTAGASPAGRASSAGASPPPDVPPAAAPPAPVEPPARPAPAPAPPAAPTLGFPDDDDIPF